MELPPPESAAATLPGWSVGSQQVEPRGTSERGAAGETEAKIQELEVSSHVIFIRGDMFRYVCLVSKQGDVK